MIFRFGRPLTDIVCFTDFLHIGFFHFSWWLVQMDEVGGLIWVNMAGGRDNSQTAKLRKPTVYDIPFARTRVVKTANSF